MTKDDEIPAGLTEDVNVARATWDRMMDERDTLRAEVAAERARADGNRADAVRYSEHLQRAEKWREEDNEKHRAEVAALRMALKTVRRLADKECVGKTEADVATLESIVAIADVSAPGAPDETIEAECDTLRAEVARLTRERDEARAQAAADLEEWRHDSQEKRARAERAEEQAAVMRAALIQHPLGRPALGMKRACVLCRRPEGTGEEHNPGCPGRTDAGRGLYDAARCAVEAAEAAINAHAEAYNVGSEAARLMTRTIKGEANLLSDLIAAGERAEQAGQQAAFAWRAWQAKKATLEKAMGGR